MALMMGIIGQLLLNANQPLLAAILYLFAVGLVIFAFRKQPGPDVILSPFQPVEQVKWTHRGYITAGLAVLSAAAAFWMFTTKLPAIYAWLLHLLSILLFILSIVWLDGLKPLGRNDAVQEMGKTDPGPGCK